MSCVCWMKTSSWDRKMGVSPWGRWAGTPLAPRDAGEVGRAAPHGRGKRWGGSKGVPSPPHETGYCVTSQGCPQARRGAEGPRAPLAHSRSSSKCVSIPSGPGTEQTSRALRKVLHLFTRQQCPPSSFCNRGTPVLSPACPPAHSPACPPLHLPGRCARCGSRRQGSAGHRPTSLGRRSRACRRSSRCCRG